MNSFLVISSNTDTIKVAVQSNFPDFSQEIMPGVWAVAVENKGPSDICEILGISGEENSNAGVVFAMSSYYGFYNPALWEKLNLWENQ